jgi:tRNA pseudouridine55 synthase
LDADNAARFLNGLARRGTWADSAQVAAYDPAGNLLGTGHITRHELIPKRLLSPLEIEQITKKS